jgi:phage N-6-adenine-methyltransferase
VSSQANPELFSDVGAKAVPALSVHFSSRTDQWPTPQALFDELNTEFGFTLDVCALPDNAKCVQYFTPEVDGLKQHWSGRCWMNPPYGKTIGKWVRKAFESAAEGATVVCLLPARTDTAWWHEYVVKADDIRFIRGRLRFGAAQSGAPFPSAVVVFRARHPVSTRLSRAVFFRRSIRPEVRG